MKKLNHIRKHLMIAISVGWFLAFRQIRRANRGTTVLIIFIMVLTFLNLVVVSGLLIGLISGSYKQFRESYSGDVIVTALPGYNFIERSSEVISFLENHPKVESFTPRYGVNVRILGSLTTLPKKNERTNLISARLTGIDPDIEERVTGFSRFIIKGEPLYADDRTSMLIGSNLLKQYSSFADANIPGLELLEGVDVGSKVRVTFTTKSGEKIIKEYTVKGIVKSKVDEISTRAFIIDKEVKGFIPVNKEEYQEIAVRVPPDYAPTLVAELKNYFGDEVARVQTSEEAIPSFLRDIESTMTILGNALSSFALVVAAITVFIVVFINAVTKRKFIGVMKGIGISPLAIEFSYICQAFFYGIVGSGIGLFLTFGVLKPYFDAYPIDFPFSDGILVATTSGSLVRVAILLVITVLAGYIPAKLIVRKNTLDSILGR
ncbi:MAG: ABC transporter permease [Patescibacteria group bacterium]